MTMLLQSNASVLHLCRRMFYAVSHDEERFAFVGDLPNYTVEAVPLFLSALLLEYLIAAWYGMETLRINDAITSLSLGSVQVLEKLIIGTGEVTVYIYVNQNFKLIDLPWDSGYTWWIAMIGIDFGYYWFHRASHEINFMWAAHQVHHSSEDFNYSTALRQSIIQYHLNWIFYVPLAVAAPPSVMLVHVHLSLLYQFGIHTELIGSLGPLELIFNTASHHRVHHGRNPYCIDKNYGGVLIIWDRIFGTFQAETDEKVVYGLVHSPNSFNTVYLQLFSYQYLWNQFWLMEGWKNKLSVLLKGPGWTPGAPRLGNPEDIPEIDYPVKKYGEPLSRKRHLYVMVHFLLFSVVSLKVFDERETMAWYILLGVVSFFTLTMTSFGSLFDQRWYASTLEFIRCMLFIIIDLVLSSKQLDMPAVPAQLMSIVRGIFILSAFAWMFVSFNDFKRRLKVHED